MFALNDVMVIVCYFSQRVDETLDVIGEDSFQAEEAVPGDTAEEGKSSSKTLTLILHFTFFVPYYISCCCYIILRMGLY